jgi:tetratricopeptide (TPR) repeat protein
MSDPPGNALPQLSRGSNPALLWRRPYLYAALALALSAAVAGVQWWVNRQLSQVEYSPNARNIREHLEKSIDEAYERQVAEAARLPEGRLRQKTLRDAERDRKDSLGMIQPSFQMTTLAIGMGNASPEFVEFIRRLDERGVDAAVDYLSSQESRLGDRVIQTHELRPNEDGSPLSLLFQLASFYRQRGDLAQAERLCEKLAATESGWGLHEHLCTMIACGNKALRENDLTVARQKYERALCSAQRLQKVEDCDCSSWPVADLAAAYEALADVSLQAGDVDQARQFLHKGLEVGGQIDDPVRRELLSLRDTIRVERPEAHPEVATAADRIDQLMNFQAQTPESLYTAACEFGLRAKLAAGWPRQGPFPPLPNAIDAKAVDPKHQQEYLQAAIDLLEAAVKAGFKDISWLEHDPALEALHDLPQYKNIVNGRH